MTRSTRIVSSLAVIALSVAAHAQLTGVRVARSLIEADGTYVAPTDPSTLYITQKGGKVQKFQNGNFTGTAVDVSGLIAVDGERGLASMAFDPNYATNGQVYLSYASYEASKALTVVRMTNFDLSTAQTIIEVPHAESNSHYSGNLRFGPDGMLYVGVGDGGGANDPNNNAQNLDRLLGKILRLDVSGSGAGYAVPSDNPYVNGGGRGEIWAYGLRNPFKFNFDGNDLYIGDVGESTWEEVNRAVDNPGGINYGWRLREGGNDNPANNDNDPGNLTDPIYDYGRTLGRSITGGFVYRGSALGSAYVGRYFFGDFVTGRLWSIDPSSTDVAGTLQEYTSGLGFTGSIVSIDPDAAGEILVTTYGGNGSVYRLEAVPEPGTMAALGLGLVALTRRRRTAKARS